MNNAFIGLYDFAASQGLLQREPDFARQLHATTQRVLALSKAATADQCSHDDDSSIPDDKNPDNHFAVAKYDSKPKAETPSLSLSPSEISVPVLARSDWGNDSPNHRDDYAFIQNFNHLPTPNEQPTQGQTTSQPSLDANNFVSDLTDVDLQHLRPEVPHVNGYQFSGIGNDQILTSPTSFASYESSFSRRLHRMSNERAFRLLMNPNSNPQIIQRVFGFSLLFRTKEQLMKAITDRMERTTGRGLLNVWSAPFVHVGGSGTYYPLPEEDITSNLMPKVRTGRSMGPLTPEAMSTREKHMIDNFTCNAEGFEGKYFDSNDVESYLRGKGIDIAPHTDYVTVNLDMISLDVMPNPQATTNFSTDGSNSISPRTPLSPNSMETSIGDQDAHAQTFEEIMDEIQTTIDLTSGSAYLDSSSEMYQSASSNWGNTPIPSLVNDNDINSNGKQPPALNAFDLRGPIFDVSSGKQSSNSYGNGESSSTSRSPRLVTLNVATLARCMYTLL